MSDHRVMTGRRGERTPVIGMLPSFCVRVSKDLRPLSNDEMDIYENRGSKRGGMEQ